MPRLAAAVQMMMATYVGGSGGGVLTTFTGVSYKIGDALTCNNGGNAKVTYDTGLVGGPIFTLAGCSLSIIPDARFGGVAPGANGDMALTGQFSATGRAMGRSISMIFTAGALQGVSQVFSTSPPYRLDQRLTKNAAFQLGPTASARYTATTSQLYGTQTGAGDTAELTLTLINGTGTYAITTPAVSSRNITYANPNGSVVWNATAGFRSGRLMVVDNSTTAADQKIKYYDFANSGVVNVSDAANTALGSFDYFGLPFQAAMVNAGQPQ